MRDSITDFLKILKILPAKFDRKDGSYGFSIQKKNSLINFFKEFSCPFVLFKILRLLAEAPNLLGHTRHTMGATMGCDPERGSKSPKSALSSDRGLELALVKLESLVDERH